MRRALLVLLFTVAATGVSGSSLTMDTGTYGGTPPDIVWWGYTYYLNDAGEPGVGVVMDGNLSLFDYYGFRVDNVAWSVLGGSWDATYVSYLSWSMCYSTGLNAQTFDQYGVDYGNSTCNPAPPVRPRDELDYCEIRPWREECGGLCPLLVRTGTGPWSLSPVQDGVFFDMDGDGDLERTSWPASNSTLAFVALDLDGNGSIDDASELFGEKTRLPDGSESPNGFVALGQYDDNSDEAIDEADPIWSFLVLWQDANRDGISQPEELQPIGTSGVTRLSTQYRWTGRHDQHGNLFRYAAQCDAQSSGPYYDVFLRNVQ